MGAEGTIWNPTDMLNENTSATYNPEEGLMLFPDATVYATNATNGTIQIPYDSASKSTTIVVRIVVTAEGFHESHAMTSKPYIFDAELAARKREEEEAARRAAEEAARRAGNQTADVSLDRAAADGAGKDGAGNLASGSGNQTTDVSLDRDGKRKGKCTDGDKSGPEGKLPRCDAESGAPSASPRPGNETRRLDGRPELPLCVDAGGNIRDANGQKVTLPFCCPPRRTTPGGLPEHICEHELPPSDFDIVRDQCSSMDMEA